ncbi:hypothetical protein KUTeg_005483 [Tegillarca granosa]|uniref:Bromo domain-containing protein n=1 Tax=Tegillarca granosa TaxID=220873 RepID=A0ABQ9FJV4_TEGGR|nr:hypothetical protein KUTeg_005483 [Tegillarca granosa]
MEMLIVHKNGFHRRRKRGERGEPQTVETPGHQIIRKLAIERIEELKRKVTEQQQKYKQIKKEVELIKSGQWDDKLPALWEQIQIEKKEAEEADRKAAEEAALATTQAEASLSLSRSSSQLFQADTEDETTQDSLVEPCHIDVTFTDDDSSQSFPTLGAKAEPQQSAATTDQKQKSTPQSALLESLLQSEFRTLDGLQQVKKEAELEHAQAVAAAAAAQAAASQNNTLDMTGSKVDIPAMTANNQAENNTTPSGAAPTLTNLLRKSQAQGETPTEVVTQGSAEVTGSSAGEDTNEVKVEDVISIDDIKTEIKEEVVTTEKDDTETLQGINEPAEDAGDISVKEEIDEDADRTEEYQDESMDQIEEPNSSYINVDDEICIKDEPPSSPASSVSSKISESDIKMSNRKKHKYHSSRGKRRDRNSRKGMDEDRKEDISSHLSDDSTDDETIPDGDDSLSGQLLNITSGTLSESIPNSPYIYFGHLLNKILIYTFRPMDLSTIKKHLESGMIRSTAEFQRDMMLMFTNAVMYNSSNQDIYKMAVEMFNDVMVHIEEDEMKRRRTSSEQHSDGGKSKKRKSRAEDTGTTESKN